MLHPSKVLASIYWNSRTSLRTALGVKRRKAAPSVLAEGEDSAFERYLRICKFYRDHLDPAEVAESPVCEVGCGDCLATSDMLLGFGAIHVDLIETLPVVVDARQREVLHRCAETDGLPNRNQVLTSTGEIDPNKITLIPKYLENVDGNDKYRVMLSFDVLEHVEDVDGFFRNCHRLLKAGGYMIHKIDLSGHSLLEDPVPPLDFQSYPDWLYALMYSKYRRATRRLQGEYLQSLRANGFTVEKVGILRGADHGYIEQLRPHLRKSIRSKSVEELEALDWYVTARKA